MLPTMHGPELRPILAPISGSRSRFQTSRKHSFVSQSPIRHKIGIHFFRLITVAMVVWLCLPVPAPIFVAPAVIGFMAFSLWLWASNLQKRL